MQILGSRRCHGNKACATTSSHGVLVPAGFSWVLSSPFTMDEVFYFLHFTGDGGIRDLQAIGESTKPMFFEFETGVSHPGNRTEVNNTSVSVKLPLVLTVYVFQIKMNRSLVASFDWHIGDKLGLATICGRQMLMSHLAYNTDTGWVLYFVHY